MTIELGTTYHRVEQTVSRRPTKLIPLATFSALDGTAFIVYQEADGGVIGTMRRSDFERLYHLPLVIIERGAEWRSMSNLTRTEHVLSVHEAGGTRWITRTNNDGCPVTAVEGRFREHWRPAHI